jgi:L-fuconolactonase
MTVIDAQVHAYERDSPHRPWRGSLPGPREVTGRDLVAAMTNVGVDKALLVSAWSLYGSDTSYMVEVQQAYPHHFAMIAPIDPYDDGAVDAVTSWGATSGAVGIRLMAGVTEGFQADSDRVRDVIKAAVEHALPVCVFCPRQLWIIEQLARVYPDAQFVLDHLGITQPLHPPPPQNPFADLNDVIAIAQYPNVTLKVTGACTLSHRPFPFDDLREPLTRLFEAFEVERCMWGTDWTRAVKLVTYEDSVTAFRDHLGLSRSDRQTLMGGTVERVFGWPAQ